MRFYESGIRAFIAVVMAVSSGQAATRINPPPVKVIDGDGFELDGVAVRLWGIDAPEMSQQCDRGDKSYPCGLTARTALESLLKRSEGLSCKFLYQDPFGRSVASCRAGREDIGAAMVAYGWAVDCERYSGGHYRSEETVARFTRRGVWAGSYVKPEKCRLD